MNTQSEPESSHFPAFYMFDAPLAPWTDAEFHPCVSNYCPKSDTTHVEQVTDESEAEFWAVYMRLEEGGLECFADVETKEQAESLATLMEKMAATYVGERVTVKRTYIVSVTKVGKHDAVMVIRTDGPLPTIIGMDTDRAGRGYNQTAVELIAKSGDYSADSDLTFTDTCNRIWQEVGKTINLHTFRN